jgi:nitrite reductase/ring-hydroxylating ferredoxin subunit
MQKRLLATLEELRRARTIKFKYADDGIEREGFLVYFHDQVSAYENSCRHIPITLDYGDNRFFTRDGKHLVCQTHGATYEPLTGFCVAGPCAGATLKKLLIAVENNSVFLLVPQEQINS